MTTSSTSTGLSVAVVDDDSLVRKTISSILVDAGYAVMEFETGTQFLSAMAPAEPSKAAFGCVLLDVKMPDMDGLQVLHQLAMREHSLSVVMISGQGDISTAVTAMRNGAIDFIEKPFTPELLVQTIELNFQSVDAATASVPSALANLSPRELEVLRHLVDGDANKVIAYKLGISQRTVEVHRARIMERLNVKTFAELVRKAIAAGL